MAHIYVKNSLSNLKAAKISINIPSFVSVSSEGEPKWFLEIATTYLTASGTMIRPVYVDRTLPFEEVDAAIADAISKIASQIDWNPLVPDDSAPYINEYKPVGSAVSIASNVDIAVKEDTPSAGIDLSETEILLSTGEVDLDITDECRIEGTPFNYSIHWEPPERKYRHYEEE